MDILEDTTFLKPQESGTLIITTVRKDDGHNLRPDRWYAEDPRDHMAAIRTFVDPYGPFFKGLAMWHECEDPDRWDAEIYSSDKAIEEWAELEDIEAEGCFGPSLVELEEESWDEMIFDFFCEEGFEPADFDDEVK